MTTAGLPQVEPVRTAQHDIHVRYEANPEAPTELTARVHVT